MLPSWCMVMRQDGVIPESSPPNDWCVIAPFSGRISRREKSCFIFAVLGLGNSRGQKTSASCGHLLLMFAVLIRWPHTPPLSSLSVCFLTPSKLSKMPFITIRPALQSRTLLQKLIVTVKFSHLLWHVKVCYNSHKISPMFLS